MSDKEIKFRACLAPIMSAIRIGGDSCRIQIDVPKSDMANVIGLAALTDTVLEFTVRVAGDKPAETQSTARQPEHQEWCNSVQPIHEDGPCNCGAGEQPDAFTMGVKREEFEPAQPLPLPPVEKEKGPWGKYWSRMFSKGFDTFPELLKELHVNGMGDSVKKALRARFHCPSLTMVSPDMFVTWVATKRLPRALIEKSERAVEELGGLAYKWGDSTRERGDSAEQNDAA